LEDLFYNFGGQCILLRDTENQPVGYIFSIIRDKKMGIYEFAYKNRSAYEGLIGYIHAHEQSVDSVVIKAAADGSTTT
jgi:predicted acetyltransferase